LVKATEQATDFLTEEIANVQAEIEESEKRLKEYEKAKNIIKKTQAIFSSQISFKKS